MAEPSDVRDAFAKALLDNGDGTFSFRTKGNGSTGEARPGAHNLSDVNEALLKAFIDNGDGTYSFRI